MIYNVSVYESGGFKQASFQVLQILQKKPNIEKRAIDIIIIIITSAKEFLPAFVYLFVCLFVSKITQKVLDGF